MKSTPQRTAIYQALVETTSHPTADALFKQVSRSYPMISHNTVYYTLGVLRDAGLVREVNVGYDRARFNANMSPHHHLICLGCQSAIDLLDDRLDRLASPADIPSDFELIGHRVEFRGFCGACRKRGQTSSHHHSGKFSHFTTNRRNV